ncbi:MAG: HAD-IIB family hydrolase [Thiothrix sp.]|nr:HAD-IIB family hydrolase [Thiothrix sp.]HPE60360.1 HAD-IIB family hydrolase [Thiolinea sp.]
MQPLEQMPDSVAGAIRCVFTDIDDTLTTEGRLPAVAYQALEQLQQAGIDVVPVTGRPAGWCDMIARFWPVAGVIGENGGFYFRYQARQKTMLRIYEQPAPERQANRRKLEHIRRRVLSEVPGAAISADQAYRELDLAVDFREDVPALPQSAIDRIQAIFEQEGAVAKVSSIHVNGWYGSHDKLSMAKRFVHEVYHLSLDAHEAQFLFCGDSPNDAPMFGYFSHACGVANVRDFHGRIEHLPAWITPSRGGQGFVEVARRLLAARRSGPD